MRRCAMAPVACSFAAGILAVQYVSLPAVFAVSLLVALCVTVLLADRPGATAIAILATLFALGALRYAQAVRITPIDVSRYTRAATSVEGIVASDPELREDRITFTLRASRVRTSGGWRSVDGTAMTTLYTNGRSQPPRIQYGDHIRARARIYHPSEPTNPGRFSWKTYLRRQGIHACASVRDGSDLHILPGRGGSLLVRWALAVRHAIERSIDRTHGRTEATVVSGMVLGTYAYLSPDTFRDFSRTGTLHLLAASGFNCWVILVLAGGILRTIQVPAHQRRVVVILLIAGYLLVAGGKPSLIRAAIMASLWLLAMPLRRAPDILNILFTSMFAILLVDPAYLFDVGFQLSFLAVLALIVAVPIMETAVARAGLGARPMAPRPRRAARCARRLARSACQTITGTVAISLVTGPVVAYYFNYVSLVSVPANLVLAGGAFLTFSAGGLAALLAYVPWIGGVVGTVGGWIVQVMLHVIDGLGALRYSAVSVASPTPLALLGYYLLLYAVLSHVRQPDALG